MPVEKIRERVGTKALLAGIKVATKEEGKTAGKVPAASGSEAERFRAAVAKLKKAEVVKEADAAWLDGLKAGDAVDGAKVAGLLVDYVSVKTPGTDADAALDELAKRGVLPDAKKYWRENARGGKTCRGSMVMQLCVRLSSGY